MFTAYHGALLVVMVVLGLIGLFSGFAIPLVYENMRHGWERRIERLMVVAACCFIGMMICFRLLEPA